MKTSTLLRLAVSLQEVKNLLEEEESVSPHGYPGILTQTLGGPTAKKKVHQKHDAPSGPRGVASVTE